MRKRYIRNTLTWLLGSKNNPSEYTHHAVLLAGALIHIHSAIFNYSLNLTDNITPYVQSAAAGMILLTWYFSRWHNQYRKMRITFIAILVLVSIPVNWLGNGGSNGPTFFLNLGVFVYIAVSYKDIGIYQKIGMFLCIFTPLPMTLLERSYPSLVYHYPNETLRQIDLNMSFVVMCVFLLVLLGSLSTRFNLEKKKAERLSEQLRAISEKDSLTGLYNRRVLNSKYNLWRNEKQEFSIALLDLDHFKNLNDQWGHQYGDEVLQSFSKLLNKVARENDGYAIRFGGEEFILMMPFESQYTYDILSETACIFRQTLHPHGPITFSAGIAQHSSTETQDSLLKKADNLMYQAKKQGRDRICTESSSLG